MKIYRNLFQEIIALENLFAAWDKFKSDKRNKHDVQVFEWRLEENIFQLHRDLRTTRYKHGAYNGFWIHDPKLRHIHKASVRDRVLHHALFRALNPIFEPTFIANSFSCRIDKGTHGGVAALERMIRKESANYTKPCFTLKCDVKKFFDSVNHRVLLEILRRKIKDNHTTWLLEEIVESFAAGHITLFEKHGLPIGNLTSQLFANIYMNEFDQFAKHELGVKHYARYTDDFVIVSNDKSYLEKLLDPMQRFLKNRLGLELHPKKIMIRNIARGIDFLGYVLLLHHRQPRTKTKQRIFRKLKQRVNAFRRDEISETTLNQSLQSYLGVLSHANTYHLSQELKNQYWFWLNE